VVHELNIKYHSPALLDDELKVSAELTKIGRVTFLMSQTVHRGDSLLVEGEVKVACLDALTKKPAAMPASMYQKLKGLLG
jgi:YbgC/YbaW family acyl-CoA thioester hydrolase